MALIIHLECSIIHSHLPYVNCYHGRTSYNCYKNSHISVEHTPCVPGPSSTIWSLYIPIHTLCTWSILHYLVIIHSHSPYVNCCHRRTSYDCNKNNLISVEHTLCVPGPSSIIQSLYTFTYILFLTSHYVHIYVSTSTHIVIMCSVRI